MAKIKIDTMRLYANWDTTLEMNGKLYAAFMQKEAARRFVKIEKEFRLPRFELFQNGKQIPLEDDDPPQNGRPPRRPRARSADSDHVLRETPQRSNMPKNPEQVIHILREHAKGRDCAGIGRDVGLHRQSVSDIVRRWKGRIDISTVSTSRDTSDRPGPEWKTAIEWGSDLGVTPQAVYNMARRHHWSRQGRWFAKPQD